MAALFSHNETICGSLYTEFIIFKRDVFLCPHNSKWRDLLFILIHGKSKSPAETGQVKEYWQSTQLEQVVMSSQSYLQSSQARNVLNLSQCY